METRQRACSGSASVLIVLISFRFTFHHHAYPTLRHFASHGRLGRIASPDRLNRLNRLASSPPTPAARYSCFIASPCVTVRHRASSHRRLAYLFAAAAPNFLLSDRRRTRHRRLRTMLKTPTTKTSRKVRGARSGAHLVNINYTFTLRCNMWRSFSFFFFSLFFLFKEMDDELR